MQVIIYPNDTGVAVVIPAENCGLTLEQIAQKDVPAEKPWRIVDTAELPPRDVRDRWRWTEAGPLDIEQAV